MFLYLTVTVATCYGGLIIILSFRYYSYCINCLTAYITESSGGGKVLTCAVCRKMFDKSGIRIARDVETAMATEVVTCADCHSKVSNIVHSSTINLLCHFRCSSLLITLMSRCVGSVSLWMSPSDP